MKGKILATAILTLLAVSAILSIIPSSLAATTTFGQTTQSGSTSTQLNTALGARYTNTIPGQANSMSAYINFAPSSGDFGQHMVIGSTSAASIENSMRGQAFTTPSYPVIANKISAWIDCSATYKVKAAIYTAGVSPASSSLVVSSAEKSISVGIGQQDFAIPDTPLQPSTTYILVVWSEARTLKILGADIYDCKLAYNNGGNSRVASTTYGSAFPSTASFGYIPDRNHFIWCQFQSAANVQCGIYSTDGTTRLGTTEQITLTTATSGWTTFNFNTKPTLTANTQYVLAAWSNNPAVNLYYTGTTAQGFTGSGSSIPATLSTSGTRNYNLYASTAYQTITASAGAGGTISPSGTTNVAYGSSQSFTITPGTGYHVTGVTIDGTTYPGEVTSYNFPSVTSDHTIVASFAINQVATALTVACTPDTVDRSGSMVTTISGTLTTSLGAPIAGKEIALTYNDGTEKPIATVTTQADGSYSYTWTAPSGLPNGFYRITAAYTGDNNPYQSSTAETAMGGGGLFVVPEYALGALGAVFAMFAAFGLVKVRHKRN